jgi:hypothetical protein
MGTGMKNHGVDTEESATPHLSSQSVEGSLPQGLVGGGQIDQVGGVGDDGQADALCPRLSKEGDFFLA